MGVSDARANAILDSVFGNGTPSSLHIGLAAVCDARFTMNGLAYYNGDSAAGQPGAIINGITSAVVTPGDEVNLWGTNSIPMLNNSSVWPAASGRSKSNATAVTLPSFPLNAINLTSMPSVCRHFVITKQAFAYTYSGGYYVTDYSAASLVAWGTLGYTYPAGIAGGTSVIVSLGIGAIMIALP